jgi:hypothetical protein
MSDLPPGLEDFGARLEQAARRDIAERRRASRRRRRLRDIGLPVGAALAAAAVSAGAVRIVDRQGAPIAPERKSGSAYQAAKDPAVVEATAVANPSGGPPWVVRAYTTPDNRECVGVGRLLHGVFGQLQAGQFRRLPGSAQATTCGNATAREPLVIVVRRAPMDVTLVYGLAVDRTPVSVRVGGRHQRVTPAGFGAFLAVFSGARLHEPAVIRSRVAGQLVVTRR